MCPRPRKFEPLFEELKQLSSSPSDLLIQAVGGILGGALSIEDLLETLLDRAIQDCGAQRGFVLINADAGGYHFLAARHARSDDLSEPWKLISKTIVERVMTTQTPAFSPDATRDPSLAGIHSVQSLAIHSLLCFPLTWLGQSIGAIYLDSHVDRFGERERSLAEELAEKASTTLGLLLSVRNYQKVIEGLQQEVQWLQRRTLPSESQPIAIVGQSEPMRSLKLEAAQVARTELTVLLVGETGTGKDLFARWIHELSPRRTGPYVAVNCAAIQDNLAESELFGHTRGAYTGAITPRGGRVEQAQGGTLFLDEIGDMSPNVQAKMLRLLESGEYFRLGEDKPRQADIRVVAATNRDLAALMEGGKFRQDLFYRMDQYRLSLPPLRERTEDIPALADHVLSQYGPDRPPTIEPEAMELLQSLPWPGNVRELNHLLRRCLIGLEPGGSIVAARIRRHLPAGLGPAAAAAAKSEPPVQLVPLADAVRQFERDYLEKQLRLQPGLSRAELAKRLGLSLRTLYNKLRELGIRAPRGTAAEEEGAAGPGAEEP
jgi:Nif-specific regulatory protein